MPETVQQPYPVRMIIMLAAIGLLALVGVSLLLYMILSGSSEPQAMLSTAASFWA